MTKSEVENAIKVVMSDVIDECYRYVNSIPGEENDRVFQIANEAEILMEELIHEIRQVKQKGGYSIDNPTVLEIKQRLNQKSFDYLNRLHNLDYH